MNHSTQEKVSMTSTVLEQLRQEINNSCTFPVSFSPKLKFLKNLESAKLLPEKP